MPSTVHPATAAIRTLALVGQAGGRQDQPGRGAAHQGRRDRRAGQPGARRHVSDFDPLERRAQHSLNWSLMHLSHRGTRIHLIDTPG